MLLTLARVLWLNWRDTRNPEAGGAETYIQELSKRLVRQGFEITQFCAAFPGSSVFEVLDGVRIIRRGDQKTVYVKAAEYFLRNRGEFDLVVDSINTIPFFAPLYTQGTRVVPLIFQVTGKRFERIIPRPLAKIASLFEICVYKILYRNLRSFVMSRGVKQDLLRLGFSSKRVVVIRPGVDTSFYYPGKKTEFPSVLYLNRVVPYKNVDDLLTAFAKVRSHLPDARLFIVGCRNHPYEIYLRSLAANLGISESVSFHPFVLGEAKREFLQESWVHVLPSSIEGWGLSVTEAAACATPTVAYCVPGLEDSVQGRKTGFLVTLGDTTTLAARITDLLTDANLRQRLSHNSVDYARTLSWDEASDLLGRVFSRSI